MNIAIYPRKSKFSPTSESIANQVAMCREYCDRCFDDPHYLVYDEDEGCPESGIAPGTAFEDIPDDWVCPVCGLYKDSFKIVEEK